MKKIIFLILSIILFWGAKSHAKDCYYGGENGNILIALSSGYGIVARAELLVTDPLGRRAGIDTTTGEIFQEIPCGFYGRERIGDLETGEVGIDETRFEAIEAIEGVYKVVIAGTASGNYYFSIFASDMNSTSSKELIEGTTYPGKIDNYEITHSAAPGAKVKGKFVSSSEIPVFDGKGQRPTDVNKFLQYFNPTRARTLLPGGTQDFNLSIIYGNTIKRKTFVAVINKNDITSQFDPLTGKGEIVKIPLKEGRNTLLLSVEGLRKDGRTAKDRDKLVFIVQPE